MSDEQTRQAAAKRLGNLFMFMLSNPQMSQDEFDTNIRTGVQMVLDALEPVPWCDEHDRPMRGRAAEVCDIDRYEPDGYGCRLQDPPKVWREA